MRFSTTTLGALLLAAPLAFGAAPAFAQDAPATPTVPDAKDAPAAKPAAEPKLFTITGGATLISDYRFRGLTQTHGNAAVQGTININTKYGFYVGTWASTIDGSGRTPLLTGYGDAEVDLYAGYTKTFSGLTVDGGLLYYYYPSHIKGLNTDFFEPYASVAYTIGPVSTKVGANYAWGNQAGLDLTAGSDDDIYVYGEASVGIPKLPVTLKGHIGYTDGSLAFVNTVIGNKSHYLDWSATAEVLAGPVKIGVTYLDTDITNRSIPIIAPGGYAKTGNFGSTVLGYIGFSF